MLFAACGRNHSSKIASNLNWFTVVSIAGCLQKTDDSYVIISVMHVHGNLFCFSSQPGSRSKPENEVGKKEERIR